MALLLGATGCIEEFDPQSSLVTSDQAANAPGAFDNYVTAITSSLTGSFPYSGSSTYPYDFGYPALTIQRDLMGQDMAICYATGSEWFTSWYTASTTGLGTSGIGPYLAWLNYYQWIYNCNTVLSLTGEEPEDDKKVGAGIALTMRALCNLEMACLFGGATYAADRSALNVPIVTEQSTGAGLEANPRATNEEMFAFILSDLDKAENYLAGYQRSSKAVPDQSVVYGLKARAYLVMEDWANAEKYAKLAQQGYTLLNQDEMIDRKTGFNSANHAWIFCIDQLATDPNIIENDGDSSWGSQMIIEVGPSGMGYSANYVGPKRVDRHLYESIPETDVRKQWFIDFAIDELSGAAKDEALLAYTDAAENIAYESWAAGPAVGGASVKFRPANGEHANQYAAWVVSIPVMRVEEMKLIEAEAAGMQNEAQGIALLTEFAKTRDASYNYGDHSADAYGNYSTGAFRNEVWWQRRVELWGEGFATFDIKRLQKGIIRSYAGTNHLEGYRWNTNETPNWMFMVIPSSEASYNSSIVNNPNPVRPEADSEEFKW